MSGIGEIRNGSNKNRYKPIRDVVAAIAARTGGIVFVVQSIRSDY
jgi:hypothetical protein